MNERLEDVLDTVSWTRSEAAKLGYDALVYFTRLKDTCPSCKKDLYNPTEAYEDCMLQKHNYALEEIKQLFGGKQNGYQA